MRYKHISGKLYEVTVLDRTMIVDYAGNNPAQDLESIAVGKVLNHEHTESRTAGIKAALFDGQDEELL